jgi:hypothetical protein
MRHYMYITVLGVGLLMTSGAVEVPAQHAARVTLKSGQVLSGDLVDLGGVGFTVRVNGEQRTIPTAEVALLDFGDGALTVPQAARTLETGSSLVVFRSGDTLVGEFYDVSGTQPLRLTFRTATGERVFPASDIRAVYLTKTDAGIATNAASTSAVGGPTRTIVVSSRTAWTATGITVAQGQTLGFTATGEITFSPQNHKATPAGSVDRLFDTRAPLPTAPQGALVARVGAANARVANVGRAILIGGQSSVVMPTAGQLFLGVNDSGLNDNRGDFTVVVSLGGS